MADRPLTDDIATESRARRKIRQAVEAKGYTIEVFNWEPIRPGGEKEGVEGGWYLEVRAPSGGMDWVMGLNWRDAVKWAEDFLKPDKTTPLGRYP